MTCQLEEKSSKISNVYLSFSFVGPLMTQKQKQDLNPLIIKILSAKCLPDTPVSIEELQVIQCFSLDSSLRSPRITFLGKIEHKL